MQLVKAVLTVLVLIFPAIDSTEDPFDNSDLAHGFVTDGYQEKVNAVCDSQGSYRCVAYNYANVQKCRDIFAKGRSPTGDILGTSSSC